MIQKTTKMLSKCMLALLSLSLIMNGCTKEEDDIKETIDPIKIEVNNDENIKKLVNFGYPIDKISTVEDGYLVENDIVFPFEHVLFSNDKQGALSSNFLVNPSKQSNIRVFLSNVAPGWATATQLAISQWNTRPNSNIVFNIVTSGSYDMLIRMDNNLAAGTIASAYLPIGTNPGSLIRINTNYNYFNLSQKVKTMAHELGHTIGFLHTDTYTSDIAGTGYTGGFVEGTAEVDPNSFMQCCTGGNPWNGFTLYDGLLLTLNYPSNPPVSGTKAFYRYFNGSNGDHFYTTNWNELGGNILTTTSHRYEGIEGYINASQVSGTVAFHRYVSLTNGDHMYLQQFKPNGFPGLYAYEGIAGYLFTSQQNGTVPLYWLFSSSQGDNFYTTSQAEAILSISSHGYTYIGIAGYLYPRPF